MKAWLLPTCSRSTRASASAPPAPSALLIFAGAAGKSGQLPLHVWLPDAMEGPTPVSALIHAATMVAAGVYLIARVYPLMSAGAPLARRREGGTTTALTVVTWVGAATAVFAALIAVAQNDIKRILAYSTVSQLGYMMAGLGLGGVAVGMFHLITHAFFKALLFLGAGSVIHGCHEEQDIRRMGGLKVDMPLTFITYAIGMLALCGFPIFFSGFWSKDGILEAAQQFSRDQRAVLSARLWRAAHRVLYDAPGLLRLLRLLARPRNRARKPEGDDAAARHPRLLRHGARPHRNSSVAVVPCISRGPRGGVQLSRLHRARLAPAHDHIVAGRFSRSRLRLATLRQQVAQAGSA